MFGLDWKGTVPWKAMPSGRRKKNHTTHTTPPVPPGSAYAVFTLSQHSQSMQLSSSEHWSDNQ